jgi:hypothetical protein
MPEPSFTETSSKYHYLSWNGFVSMLFAKTFSERRQGATLSDASKKRPRSMRDPLHLCGVNVEILLPAFGQVLTSRAGSNRSMQHHLS